ncbi:heme NO-binding domain-containing protein [Catenovulum sp. SM1970]|uniref:heme NO-binding domain-containing protein n=1 Tax=Marinifaba aquimaris TaxID=2741323 RepID=UPI0015733102|nr:heme NO-binding domain-containing protein [Marinifaba aquimaris]NTS76154.1 heme NO-binding domain-containing protein [Marinifaba aquimaris]
MKGTVFNHLQEFVEQSHGYTVWDQAISTLDLPSKGIYVGTQSYDDTEITMLAVYLAEQLNAPLPDLIRSFGYSLFSHLMPMAPEQAKQAKDLRTFLHMVEKIIHVEVLKLYQDVNLPKFDYIDEESKYMTMIYRSPRKLCFLSEGLILGAADHFKEQVKIDQSKCMHKGDDCCHIEIEFL